MFTLCLCENYYYYYLFNFDIKITSYSFVRLSPGGNRTGHTRLCLARKDISGLLEIIYNVLHSSGENQSSVQ